MQRLLIVAGLVSAAFVSGLVVGFAFGFLRPVESSEPPAIRSTARTQSVSGPRTRSVLHANRRSDSTTSAAGGREIATGFADRDPDSAAVPLEDSAGGVPETSRSRTTPPGAATQAVPGSDREKSPNSSDPSKSGGDTAKKLLDRGGLLEGEALTSALLDALGAEELGPLQALLISELTAEGTRFTEEQIPDLFAALLDVDDFGLQKLALTHLERIEAEGSSDALVDGYLDYLESARKPHHAEAVLESIAKLGGDYAVDGLSEFLRGTESDRMRAQAAEALAAMKDPRAVPVIRDVLFSNTDPRQARTYMEALAQLGGAESIAAMIDYASIDGNEHVHKSLHDIRDPEAAPLLSGSLRGRVSEPYTRTALRKLGSLADPRTVPDLERFLDRASGLFVRETLQALGQFRDVGAARALESYAARQPNRTTAKMALRYAERVHRRAASSPAGQNQPKSDRRQQPERRAG